MLFPDKRILGLDVGSNSLKVAEIKHNGEQKELITYGVANHKIDLDGYWDANKLQQFAEIITQLRKKAGISTLKTVVAIQSKHVFVTTMDFEISWNKRMIQEEINRQAKFFLPYPPDEMRLNWNIIPSKNNISSMTGKQRVVINALPNFVVENITNLLNRCSLEGVALENQTVSLARALVGNSRKNIIIVDLGAQNTTYSIIIDNILRNSFTSTVGFDRLDEAIQSSLGVSDKVGENFKKDLGLVNLFELPKEFTDHYSIIKGELNTFYEQNIKIAQIPEEVIITGGGVNTAGFVKFISSFTIPVTIGRINTDLHLDQNKKDTFSPLSSILTTSIGLALRDDV
jgi:type IV pilus assembly protein PilM